MNKPPIIVTIGGSAGCLEALVSLFDHTPWDNASYVILRHIPRDYQSRLKDILQHHSRLQLVNVVQSTHLQPNTVYIAPSAQDLILKDNTLELVVKPRGGPNLCVNRFFSSMARQTLGKRAIVIVLSGSGFDGVSGAQDIKKAGELVIAQDPLFSNCKYMPQHVIESGSVDHVAVPSQIPRIIQEYERTV